MVSIDMRKSSIRDFMKEKGWLEQRCSGCGKIFFTKQKDEVSDSICGWHKCKNDNYSFRKLSKRKSLIKPEKINLSICKFFRSKGFELKQSLNVANDDGLTDLIVAGVQIFDSIIHRGEAIKPEKMLISQPCVRMQFQPIIKDKDGISTSFVNICTEQMGGSFTEHLEYVDDWVSALSQLGLFVNDFTVVMNESVDDWGTGEFTKIELFFLYGDLELGDASYFEIPQKDRDPIVISDIGFGLERISWALNKSETYFDTLMPLAFLGDREMFDSCRTLSLLSICGVKASNKGPGLQFRRFAKVISEKYFTVDIYEILAFYFDYWSNFIDPVIPKSEAVNNARIEIERLVNLRICGMLGLPLPQKETMDAYLDRLVYTFNIDINQLREAVGICRK